MGAAEIASVVVAIVAALAAVGSLIVAVLAERRAREAEAAAREARAGTDSVEESLQRMADVMVALLEEVHWRRAQPAGPSSHRVHPSASPDSPPEFTIEFVRGRQFRLRNVSARPATNVRATAGDLPLGMTRDLPNGIELAPFQSSPPFLILSAWGVQAPGELLVDCEELAEPVHVPLPPTS